LDDQNYSVERALWAALRALEENEEFSHRLADFARKAHRSRAARIYEERARTAKGNADVLRDLLVNRMGIPPTAGEVSVEAVPQ